MWYLYYLEIPDSITTDILQGFGEENSPLSSAFGPTPGNGQVGTFEEEQRVAFLCPVSTNVDMVPNRPIAVAHPITFFRSVTGRSSWKILTKQYGCSLRIRWQGCLKRLVGIIDNYCGAYRIGGFSWPWWTRIPLAPTNAQDSPLSAMRIGTCGVLPVFVWTDS